MRRKLKAALDTLGVWYFFSLVRSIPSILRWIENGCRGPAPHSIKMRIIRSYLKRYNIDNFLETGTYKGESLGFIAKTGVRCTSIELSDELFRRARARFNGQKNVRLIHGDSGEVVPRLLVDIDEPTLFWLDGHYSAGNTAIADSHTPISKELSEIFAHPIRNHVILIDDAHCFTGMDNYPCLDNLLKTVRDEGGYNAEVSADIIRLIPRALI